MLTKLAFKCMLEVLHIASH